MEKFAYLLAAITVFGAFVGICISGVWFAIRLILGESVWEPLLLMLIFLGCCLFASLIADFAYGITQELDLACALWAYI